MNWELNNRYAVLHIICPNTFRVEEVALACMDAATPAPNWHWTFRIAHTCYNKGTSSCGNMRRKEIGDFGQHSYSSWA